MVVPQIPPGVGANLELEALGIALDLSKVSTLSAKLATRSGLGVAAQGEH
jgi:hypothetical protein